MKKFSIILCAALLNVCAALAIPAHKGAAKVTQPDGTTLTLRLHGDEFMHFNTTADGYSVVPAPRGGYAYARLQNGQLLPTEMLAHDAGARTAAEQAWLQGVERYLSPQPSPQAAREQQAEQQRRQQALQQRRVQQYDYTKFRGLILLVEFNDCQFSYDNIQEIMDGMINEDNYTGTDITNVSRGGQGRCTGSVRDYYRDCSNGLFVPDFDVVGPVQVDYSQYSFNGYDNAGRIMIAALDAADELVDYSQYDRDGDGQVEMVYFIYAGLGSNFSGNDSRLLWPHASSIYNPDGGWYDWQVRRDGVAFGRYACGTELYGTPQWSTLDGIGTICHEFGHVLGLPDFYDTDYDETGGTSAHPGEWTVMAGGGYMNYGRTPAVYTLFERYALGWATPQVINAEGSYTLESLDDCNTGYRINSGQNREYFMLENRQQTKWNQYLPGHGMLVFRVDSTSQQMWTANRVNINPEHNYFEMVRAGRYAGSESASDPFPGSNRVTVLNNSTSPGNLLSWTKKTTKWGLENISEQNGVITFDVLNVDILRSITLPETFTVGVGVTRQLTETRTPDYAPYTLTWQSSDPSVVTVSAKGELTGVAEGTATVTVTANNELTAQTTVTVVRQNLAANIAEFLAYNDGEEVALTLQQAQVVYVYKNKAYLRDASGSLVLNNTGLSLAKDQMLTGMLYGRRGTSEQVAELTAVANMTTADDLTITTGTTAKPRSVRVQNLTEADHSDLLTLHQATLKKETGGVFAIAGDKRVRIYNTFAVKNLKNPSAYDGLRFDVTGILVTRLLNGQYIDELALTESIAQASAQQYTLSYNIAEGGTVLLGDQELSQQGQTAITEGDYLRLSVVPGSEWDIAQVLLDDVAISGNVIVVNEVTGNHTLTVDFTRQLGIDALQQNRYQAGTPVSVFTLDGRPVATTAVGHDGTLALPTSSLRPGIYVVRAGHTVQKVVVR